MSAERERLLQERRHGRRRRSDPPPARPLEAVPVYHEDPCTNPLCMRRTLGPRSAIHPPIAAETNPEEFFLALLCVVAAAGILAGAPLPTSMQDVAPNWLIYIWCSLLAAGGVLILAGLLTKRINLEVAGLAATAPLALAFSLAISAFNGWAVTAVFLVGYAISCAVRIRTILKSRRLTREINGGWERAARERLR